MNPRIRVFALALLLCATAVVGWSLYQRAASAAAPPTQLMPEGALLCIEAKDFAGLLHDWSSSPEKAQWVKSDNYAVFSNSRLFLRLSKASDEFKAAAGISPDMNFLGQAAGQESALAVYDIGELHFLYVTRLPAGSSFLQSPLWQSRNKFQTRTAGGIQFFTRSDQESSRTVAFSVAGDYLVLGTRDDLVAGALELYSGTKGRTMAQESWYTQALASAPKNPGDLRMVLHMEKVAVTPHFRTYWIQQNITQMQGYLSAVSDLYREGATYREERVMLAKKPAEDDAAFTQAAQSVSGLLPLVPREYGFYQARATDAKGSLAVLQQKILAPTFGAAVAEKLAPQVQLGSGEIGTGSDLETRIDVEQAPRTANESSAAGLLKQLEAASPQALLVLQGARKNKDGVLLNIPTVMVLSASGNWDLAGVQKAMQDVIAPGMTASSLGLQWREIRDAGGYYDLDGLYPVQIAVRGKLLYVSNQAEMLSSVLQTKPAASPAQQVSYAAGFNHARERQSFYDLTTVADQSAVAARSNGSQQREPQFFSDNVSSFSRSFARVAAEEVVGRQTKNRMQQTVTYHWSQ